MSAEVSGAVERLIYLLEKHFSPVGNPPQMPNWSFEVDQRRDDPAGYLGDRGAFGSLIEVEPTEAIREAIEKIPPLAEVADALRNLCAMIETNGDRSEWHHLRDAFLRLTKADWVTNLGNSSSHGDTVVHRFGYVFAVVDRQLLAELRDAARNLALIPVSRSTPSGLNATQRAAFEIIRDEGPILGKTLAKRLGIAGDTLRKHVLPALKPHGLTNRRNGRGYAIG